MAAYAQLGYGYPSARQLLVSGAQPTVPIIAAPSSAHSPISISQQTATSRSPNSSGGTTHMHSTHIDGNAHNCGSLTPDATSQSSNTATSSIATGSTGAANGSGSPFIGATDGATMAPITPTCCDNGRLILADPISGQTVCSCQYDSARLAALNDCYSAAARMQPAAATTANVSLYGTHYAPSEQNPYPTIGVDSAAAFYPSLSNPYSVKDSSSSTDITAWTTTGLQPSTSYYTYDPTLAAYGYGASYDLASRRKNATRESTATLKAWLNEHKKNPYPTKGEKIMLAIITKMTLTQVSTWFANARRRLKKENKVTWEPKSRTDDDDDAIASEDELADREKERGEKVQTPNALSHQRNNGASTATTTPTTATDIGTGVVVGVGDGGAVGNTTEVGIADQPTKDLYEQQQQQTHQQQYSHAYYYNNNNSQQHTTYQQQQFLQQQQHMPLTVLSQHIADSMLLHQQQQQHRLQQ